MLPSLTSRRSGTISVASLIVLPVMFLLVGLVLYFAMLREAKGEVQNGADATALAACRALACDDLLTGDHDRARARLNRAREAAATLARANLAHGEPLALDLNPDNDPDGDIVFGHLDRPLGEFRPTGNHPHDWVGDQINAVRVTVGRSPVRAPLGGKAPRRDVRSRATALLDWHVVGFCPQGEDRAPLVPICLFTDHKNDATDGWRVACRDARDEWRFDPEKNQFVPGSDGIPEVVVVLGPPRGRAGEVRAAFLRLGDSSPAIVVEQIRSGVNRHHLAKWGGEFALGAHNTVGVTGSFDCPGESDPTRGGLEDALRAAGCGPRAWPLFTGYDEGTGSVRVCGWAGARIVSVERAENGGLVLRLQPAVVAHPSVVADPGRASAPPFWATNRTVCAVRLAE